MEQINEAAAVSAAHKRGESRATALLFGAMVVIAAWVAATAALIGGFHVWTGSSEYLTHLIICVVGMSISAAYATRVQGGLDAKLSQAAAGAVLVFGLYALVLLGGRLFFSRSMLLSTFTGAVAISATLVWLRHRLARERVALIAPLLGQGLAFLPHGRIVRDPATDLRGFDTVLVSLTEPLSADWARALSRAMLAGCRVRHVGEYVEELKGCVSLEHFEVEHLPPNGIASYRLVKRIMDVGLVVFLLPVTVPLLVLAGLAILVTMSRPIFFVQERAGLGGEPFRMWKLRTMRPERPGERLRATVVGDGRVTPLGRILRRFRIDELPQLWNVLKGDMSLIGPRPEATPLHSEYLRKLPNYTYRYLVRPGITGWAQVCAPPSANADEARRKLTYDLYYVKHMSLFLDLQIVLRTVWTVTHGSGVR